MTKQQSDNHAIRFGVAYVFAQRGGTWSLQGTLSESAPQSGDQLATTVALDGATAIIGLPNRFCIPATSSARRGSTAGVAQRGLKNRNWTSRANPFLFPETGRSSEGFFNPGFFSGSASLYGAAAGYGLFSRLFRPLHI